MVLCYYKALCFRFWLFWLIRIPAWLYLFFWIAMQILFLKTDGEPVNYAAHIGGFLFGVIGGIALAVSQRYSPETGEWHGWLRQPRGI